MALEMPGREENGDPASRGRGPAVEQQMEARFMAVAWTRANDAQEPREAAGELGSAGHICAGRNLSPQVCGSRA